MNSFWYDKRRDMVYPETVVVHISSHGEIPVDQEVPATFLMPPDMMLLKLTASPQGVSYITSNSIQDHLTEILENSDVPRLMELIREQPDDKSANKVATTELKDFIRLGRYYDRKVLDSKSSKITKTLRHTLNKSYAIGLYRDSRLVLNKTFSEDVRAKNNKWYWKANLVNVPGQPDLLSILPKMGGGYDPMYNLSKTPQSSREITLQQIIEYLNQKHVKNVFIFDSTCSSFSEQYSPRTKRRVRRTMRKQNLHG
jgi:hypothetical protein